LPRGLQGRDFYPVPAVIAADPRLGSSAKLIWGYMHYCQSDNSGCPAKASLRTIAGALGFNLKTARRGVRALQVHGLLEVVHPGVQARPGEDGQPAAYRTILSAAPSVPETGPPPSAERTHFDPAGVPFLARGRTRKGHASVPKKGTSYRRQKTTRERERPPSSSAASTAHNRDDLAVILAAFPAGPNVAQGAAMVNAIAEARASGVGQVALLEAARPGGIGAAWTRLRNLGRLSAARRQREAVEVSAAEEPVAAPASADLADLAARLVALGDGMRLTVQSRDGDEVAAVETIDPTGITLRRFRNGRPRHGPGVRTTLRTDDQLGAWAWEAITTPTAAPADV